VPRWLAAAGGRLRGHLSGLAIPTYVVYAPHGDGKIPLLPNYLVSASDDCVVLRNYEGMLVRYQAEDKPKTTRPTVNRGVSQLVQSTTTAIVPRENESLERRRQYLQNKAAAKESACCDEQSKGRKSLAVLPVVAER